MVDDKAQNRPIALAGAVSGYTVRHRGSRQLRLRGCAMVLDFDIDFGQDALAMRGASQGWQVGANGIHQLSMQLPIGHCQRTLQHIVGIWVLQGTPHTVTQTPPGDLLRASLT